MATRAEDAPVHLVRGSDAILVDRAVGDLVGELVGDGDRSMMVDELSATSYDPGGDGDLTVSPLVDAAQTPPFLTDRRVVVARHAATLGRSGAKDRLAPLVGYLDDPLPTTSLVLVWEKAPTDQKASPLPKWLGDAVKGSGGVVVDADPPGQAKARGGWVDAKLAEASVVLDRAAQRRVAEHLGEQVNRIPELLATLEGAYGARAHLGVADVEPFLGEAGGVAPWDLTDAIDAGDVPTALSVLERMMGGGARPAMAVFYSLQRHVMQLARLDGEEDIGEKQAAEILGMKGSTFPAKKALAQSRRLGSERIAALVALTAQADLDLRGARAIEDRVVMEVLVARLAQRSRR